MLPFIVAGVAIVAGAAYVLSEAEADAKRAQKRYNRTRRESEESIRKRYEEAQRRHEEDQRTKMRRAKAKVADSIYAEIKSQKEQRRSMSATLKEYEKRLRVLHEQKRQAGMKERWQIAKQIKEIEQSIKRLQVQKEALQASIDTLYEKLKDANAQVASLKSDRSMRVNPSISHMAGILRGVNEN
ncbi:MAG: hypothetical protein L3J47_12460 [Sulfurovum sp.]|nr:hypothetical protein [Sulfurovum sp.]